MTADSETKLAYVHKLKEEIRYFGKEELPDKLAVEKTTKEQILMCFQAHEAEHWKVIVD